MTLYETEYYRQTSKLPSLSVEYCLECSSDVSCDASAVTHDNLKKVMEFLIEGGAPSDENIPYAA